MKGLIVLMALVTALACSSEKPAEQTKEGTSLQTPPPVESSGTEIQGRNPDQNRIRNQSERDFRVTSPDYGARSSQFDTPPSEGK